MDSDLDLSDALHVQTAGADVQPPARYVRPLDRVPTTLRPKTREPRGLSTQSPPIETLERFVKATQSSAADGHTPRQHVRSHGPQTGESAVLLVLRDPAPFPPPRASPFLQCGVVQLPLRTQHRLERNRLASGWLKQIVEGSTRHKRRLTTGCDTQSGSRSPCEPLSGRFPALVSMSDMATRRFNAGGQPKL
jgi:hypothetical protein